MKFTLVTTVWQRPEHLPRLLHCVIQQTHPDWELRIYGDGPQPGVREMLVASCSKLGVTDRVDYKELPRKPGAFGNHLRRAGLDAALGDYVCFLGHDCIIDKDFLAAHMFNIRDRHDVLSVVTLRYWTKRQWGAPGVELPLEEYLTTLPWPGTRVAELGEGKIDLSCTAYPTALARTCGVFREAWDQRYEADAASFTSCMRNPGCGDVLINPQIVGAHF